jgi:hypothetical protein
LAGLAIVLGISIVANSAQFSASVIKLSEPKWVGTMLTVQTSVGFLITLVTIHLIPVFVDALTWRWALAPLAIGPALSILAMARLRATRRQYVWPTEIASYKSACTAATNGSSADGIGRFPNSSAFTQSKAWPSAATGLPLHSQQAYRGMSK